MPATTKLVLRPVRAGKPDAGVQRLFEGVAAQLHDPNCQRDVQTSDSAGTRDSVSCLPPYPPCLKQQCSSKLVQRRSLVLPLCKILECERQVELETIEFATLVSDGCRGPKVRCLLNWFVVTQAGEHFLVCILYDCSRSRSLVRTGNLSSKQ
jgi:hypothetical protein